MNINKKHLLYFIMLYTIFINTLTAQYSYHNFDFKKDSTYHILYNTDVKENYNSMSNTVDRLIIGEKVTIIEKESILIDSSMWNWQYDNWCKVHYYINGEKKLGYIPEDYIAIKAIPCASDKNLLYMYGPIYYPPYTGSCCQPIYSPSQAISIVKNKQILYTQSIGGLSLLYGHTVPAGSNLSFDNIGNKGVKGVKEIYKISNSTKDFTGNIISTSATYFFYDGEKCYYATSTYRYKNENYVDIIFLFDPLVDENYIVIYHSLKNEYHYYRWNNNRLELAKVKTT